MSRNMATTPPPTSRVHTPPAPLHGSRYDEWQPYSPRATRASSRLNMRAESRVAGPSSTQHKTQSRITAAKNKRALVSHALSPPSSPEPQAQKSATAHRTQQHIPSGLDAFNRSADLDTDTPAAVMLPTPAKTPRKRNQDASMPTARVLNFQPTTLEHAMPTPRKQRKSRLTLLDEDAPEPETFTVFTDAQDRVPDLDRSDNNPFVGPRKKNAHRPSSKKPQHDEHSKIEEAVRDDRGIYYAFRGKHIFRPFSDADTGHEPESSGQASLKRKAGVAAQRPITRSTVKPQLLWPSKDQLREKKAREAAMHEDEEADTDIEQEEHFAPSMSAPAPAPVKDLTTPAKTFIAQPAHVMTPPSSHRATRSASKKLSFLSDFGTILESDGPASPAPTPQPQQKAGTKRASPFETWQRTKSTLSSDTSAVDQGRKRPHSTDPDEQASRKRSCNTTSGLGRV